VAEDDAARDSFGLVLQICRGEVFIVRYREVDGRDGVVGFGRVRFVARGTKPLAVTAGSHRQTATCAINVTACVICAPDLLRTKRCFVVYAFMVCVSVNAD
jgi:hypothetical protein